jgi:hypothetical protein
MTKDKRSLPYGGAFPIMDSNMLEHINTDPTASPVDFCNRYLEWIKSTTLNKITGIDSFPVVAYANGTSEVFDKFYMRNNKRRFRCFRGEYMYHQVTWRTFWPNWKFIEDAGLDPNDAVVISLPFSNLGTEHPEMQQILNKCTDLNIPVLIDCAYFGICSGIHFNFDHPCITDIAFSLSKSFPLAHARLGMRLTRVDDDDPLLVYHKIQYTNKMATSLAISLMDNFTPDYIVNKYKSKQLALCKELGVEPSDTVLFGIDKEDKYPEYNRGGIANRLSFHNHLNV